jgi:hypothetical protein
VQAAAATEAAARAQSAASAERRKTESGKVEMEFLQQLQAELSGMREAQAGKDRACEAAAREAGELRRELGESERARKEASLDGAAKLGMMEEKVGTSRNICGRCLVRHLLYLQVHGIATSLHHASSCNTDIEHVLISINILVCIQVDAHAPL